MSSMSSGVSSLFNEPQSLTSILDRTLLENSMAPVRARADSLDVTRSHRLHMRMIIGHRLPFRPLVEALTEFSSLFEPFVAVAEAMDWFVRSCQLVVWVCKPVEAPIKLLLMFKTQLLCSRVILVFAQLELVPALSEMLYNIKNAGSRECHVNLKGLKT